MKNIFVVIAIARSQRSDETAHPRSLARAFAACIHNNMEDDGDSDQNLDQKSHM